MNTSAFSHSGRWNSVTGGRAALCMQGIMDAPLLKSGFRLSTLKLKMNLCTNSANVNSWVMGRLLYEQLSCGA